MSRPQVYREPHPYFESHPWRVRVHGASWPFKTWSEALAYAITCALRAARKPTDSTNGAS